MTVAAITTHRADATARLLQQYANRPRMLAIISALAAEVQLCENVIAPFNTGRMLYGGNAVGAQLDQIGQLVGLARNGVEDGLYYVLLLGTIGKNNTDTTPAKILNVARTVYQGTAVYLKTPTSTCRSPATAPAVISLEIVAPQTAAIYWPICQQIVQDSLAAGVAIAEVIMLPSTQAFAMAGGQAWVGGFSSVVSPSVGGVFPVLAYSNKAQ